MKRLNVFLVMSLLVACYSRTPVSHVASVAIDTIKVNSKNEVKSNLQKPADFPVETLYPAHLLTAGGMYHGDEVDPNASFRHWKDVFQNDSVCYISDTKLTITKEYDAVMDEEGQQTGRMIKTSNRDSALLLISGLKFLDNRKVEAVKLAKTELLPGEQEQFTFHSTLYTLYATGNKTQDKFNKSEYFTTNYRLFIKATIHGRTKTQLLVSMADNIDHLPTFIFVGDIDGDTYPDFIIDTSSNDNAERPTLYLSKPAEYNDLLKIVGMSTFTGC